MATYLKNYLRLERRLKLLSELSNLGISPRRLNRIMTWSGMKIGQGEGAWGVKCNKFNQTHYQHPVVPTNPSHVTLLYDDFTEWISSFQLISETFAATSSRMSPSKPNVEKKCILKFPDFKWLFKAKLAGEGGKKRFVLSLLSLTLV